jgi:hypothetical protein
MLVRLQTVAMLSGLVAMFVALWLGLPVWMVLLAYSFAGSAALLLGGALVAFSKPMHSAKVGFHSTQPEPPVSVLVRR